MTALDELLQRASAARNAQRHAEALRLYEEAAAIAPQPAALRLECAHQLDLLGRREEAETIYRELAGILPENARVHRGLGKACRDRGLIDEAISHYRKAAELEPGTRWIVSEYLELLRGASREAEAEDFIADLAEASPKSAFPWIERAKAARDRGQPEDVRAALVTALLKDPQSIEALGMLAMEERSRGNEQLSIAACRRILELDPAYPYASLIEAAFHREGGRFAEAETVLAQALSHNSQHRAVRLELAKAKRRLGLSGEARSLLEGLAADHPGDADVLEELVSLEIEAGNSVAAAAHTAAVLKLGGARPRAPLDLARHYLGQYRFEDARRLLNESVSHVGAAATLLVEWASLESQCGDSDRAMELVEEALAREPAYFEAAVLKSRLLLESGWSAEALSNLEERSEALAARPDFHAHLAHLYLQTGFIDKGIAIADAGRKMHPQDFGILNQWLATAIRCGRLAEVQSAIEDFKPRNSEQRRQIAIMRAQACRAEGRYAEAYQQLGSIAAAAGCPPYVHVEAARAAIALLDAGAARAHLKQYFEGTKYELQSLGRRHNISQSLLGQIADEYQLDPESIAAARAALDLPEGPRIEALQQAVLEYPEQTGCAIGLLIEMRRAGHFQIRRAQNTRAASPIPRRIFQYWDAPDVPNDVQQFCRSWQEHNPDFSYTLYHRKSAAEYLRQHAPAEVQLAFQRLRQAAGRADIFRLFVLHAEGGIYADADDRCLGKLAPVIEQACFFAIQEDIGSIGNNVLGASPGHPVIAHALSHATGSIAAGANDSIWLSTGPGQLSRSFAQLLASQEDQWATWLEDHRIFDWTGVSAFCAPQCFAAYKNTSAHWLQAQVKRRRAIQQAEG
jgi:mannosyltransferase OCH1-like enzyme/tetratricopeptide (TPR) repeat protein